LSFLHASAIFVADLAADRRVAVAVLVRVTDEVTIAIEVVAVISAELRLEVVVPGRVILAVMPLRGVAEAERLLVILGAVAAADRLLHGVVDVLIELPRVLRAEVASGLLPVVAERCLDALPAAVHFIRVPPRSMHVCFSFHQRGKCTREASQPPRTSPMTTATTST